MKICTNSNNKNYNFSVVGKRTYYSYGEDGEYYFASCEETLIDSCIIRYRHIDKYQQVSYIAVYKYNSRT